MRVGRETRIPTTFNTQEKCLQNAGARVELSLSDGHHEFYMMRAVNNLEHIFTKLSDVK